MDSELEIATHIINDYSDSGLYNTSLIEPSSSTVAKLNDNHVDIIVVGMINEFFANGQENYNA